MLTGESRFFLLRHSFAEIFGASDRERELTPAGIQAAQQCGKRLRGMGFLPDLVVCSPARRAVQTAELVASELALPQRVIVAEAHLYDCTGEEIPDLLEPYFAQGKVLLAVGHNPAVSEWTSICGEPGILLPCEGRFFRRRDAGWEEYLPQ